MKQQLVVQQMMLQQLVVQQMMLQQQQQHQQMLAQQHQQHLLAMQQFGGAHPLLGGLGLGGHMGSTEPGRGYPSPDPIRSLLGGLHTPGDPHRDAQDPLKALLARQQQQQQQQAHFTNSSPPLQHTAPRVNPSQTSLFGLAGAPGPGPLSTGAPFTGAGTPNPLTAGTTSTGLTKGVTESSNPLLGPNPLHSAPQAPTQAFDPIQSLLEQLQGGRSTGEGPAPGTSSLASQAPALTQTTPSSNHAPTLHTTDTQQYNIHQPTFSRAGVSSSIWDLPEPAPAPAASSSSPPVTSIWNSGPNEPSTEHPPQLAQHQQQTNCGPQQESSPDPNTDSGPDETPEHVPESPGADPTEEPVANNQEPGVTNFVKPKANEKKDKKSKKAEEKRKAKEKAKKDAEPGAYIPGMSSVKPEEQVVAVSNILDQKREEEIAAQRAQMEALARLQEEQRLRLEKEELARHQQERLDKLAPWAKKEASVPQNGSGEQLSLQEIQRIQAERDRAERAQQEAIEARAREEARWREEEEKRARAAKTINWATISAGGTPKVKSLAEIQAEEARVEKERAERERDNIRSVRQSSAGANSSVWGGGMASKATSWAGKIAASSPAPAPRPANGGNPWGGPSNAAATNGPSSAAAVVAPAGFWDPVLPETERTTTTSVGANTTNNSSAAGKKNKKNKNKKMEEEAKVKQIFGEKKPKNEFEDWCTSRLQAMQAQVDIPTFLGFLMDIESPYEVHDYIKSYVGEEKAQKKFAVDYLERRSRWKRSLKTGAAYEDDLTTPANALIPGDTEEFKEAGKKGKKTGKATSAKVKGKQDMSHLLGFSVSGQGVNRGELDMPH